MFLTIIWILCGLIFAIFYITMTLKNEGMFTLSDLIFTVVGTFFGLVTMVIIVIVGIVGALFSCGKIKDIVIFRVDKYLEK